VSDALKAIKGLNPSLRNALSSFLIHDIASSSFFAFAGIYVLAESELLIKALSSWKKYFSIVKSYLSSKSLALNLAKQILCLSFGTSSFDPIKYTKISGISS
jgi:hypothetical protein